MNRDFEWMALYESLAEGEAAPVGYLLFNAERAFRKARISGLLRSVGRYPKAGKAGASAAGREVRIEDIHGLKALPPSLKDAWMRSFYRRDEDAEPIALVRREGGLFLDGDAKSLLRLELLRAWGHSSVSARLVEPGLDFSLAKDGKGSLLPLEGECLKKCV
jgi:hypothetical protein